MLAEFRPAYDQLQRGLQDARRSAALGVDGLRIGFATVGFADTTNAIVAALSEDPRIDGPIVSSWHPPNDLYRWLRRGHFEVDVFFSWFPDTPGALPAQLQAGAAVRSEPLGVMMPRRHPLAGRRQIDVEDLADHEVLHPSGHAEQADAWVPPRTPAGRPIRRVRLPYEYMEDLPRVMAETDLLHLTIATEFDQFPVPASATVAALNGLPPIVYRAVWSRASDTEARRAVAAIAAEVGERQGWLRHDRGDAR